MNKTKLDKMIFDRIAVKYEEISNKAISDIRRKALNNDDFTIISNNCWGGHVYRRFGLQYKSPTVGLYFYSDEYIRFLKDLENNLYGDIRIINSYDSKYKDDLLRKNQSDVVIGLINNSIEVVFLHYHSPEEAIEKWRRRAERVNMDNLIVKFSQMNNCSIRNLMDFSDLEYKKKVLFLASKVEGINGVVIKRYSDNNQVVDDTTYYSNHISLKQLINS